MSSRDGTSSSSSSSSSGGETRKTNKGNVITMPTPAYMAPAGASLGQSTSTGGSLVSTGDGRAVDMSNGSLIGTSSGTTIPRDTGESLVKPNQNNLVSTTVKQTPAENSGGTTVSGGPRSDFSQVLAGQINERRSKAPSRSTNFVSLIGGAGGLGRRTDSSRRTLIGGA